jgi:hypothetical protein
MIPVRKANSGKYSSYKKGNKLDDPEISRKNLIKGTTMRELNWALINC